MSRSRQKQTRAFLNQAGSFHISPKETIRQMAERFDEGRNLGWPGSISIHGNELRSPANVKRRHLETEAEQRQRKQRNKDRGIRPRGRSLIGDQSTISATKRFAESDKSDPFAYNRAVSHVYNGICTTRNIDGEEKPCRYDAEEVWENETTALGEPYKVKRFRNIIRP